MYHVTQTLYAFFSYCYTDLKNMRSSTTAHSLHYTIIAYSMFHNSFTPRIVFILHIAHFQLKLYNISGGIFAAPINTSSGIPDWMFSAMNYNIDFHDIL